MNACAYIASYAFLVTMFCFYLILSIYKAQEQILGIVDKWKLNRETLQLKLKSDLSGKSADEISQYITANFNLND